MTRPLKLLSLSCLLGRNGLKLWPIVSHLHKKFLLPVYFTTAAGNKIKLYGEYSATLHLCYGSRWTMLSHRVVLHPMSRFSGHHLFPHNIQKLICFSNNGTWLYGLSQWPWRMEMPRTQYCVLLERLTVYDTWVWVLLGSMSTLTLVHRPLPHWQRSLGTHSLDLGAVDIFSL